MTRKSDEEITREVFGQGSRWIGWNSWLKHQLIFKYIEYKVDQGILVGNNRSFHVAVSHQHHDTVKLLKVNIKKEDRSLESIEIPCVFRQGMLTVTKNSCTYVTQGGGPVVMSEIFEDPWRPTFEELDLFGMLYGDEQILIDMNKDFYGTILEYNRAAGNKKLKIYIDQERW